VELSLIMVARDPQGAVFALWEEQGRPEILGAGGRVVG
jgi:hypothetical protein